MNFEAIPEELKDRRQWVVWGDGKIPFNPITGRPAKSNDPATWSDFGPAVAAARQNGFRGIGLVFADTDPFVGIDLDNCVTDAGTLEPWAADIAAKLDSYTEYSPSGNGLHIIIRGSALFRGKQNGHIEIYSSHRYFTMTGDLVEGYPASIEERTEELAELCCELFPEPKTRPSSGVPLSAGEVREPYVKKALEAEAEAVRSASQGSRNHTLNRAAFSLGQFVGAGVLERTTVEVTLTEAATTAGLTLRETERTIRSGLESGIAEPRLYRSTDIGHRIRHQAAFSADAVCSSRI